MQTCQNKTAFPAHFILSWFFGTWFYSLDHEKCVSNKSHSHSSNRGASNAKVIGSIPRLCMNWWDIYFICNASCLGLKHLPNAKMSNGFRSEWELKKLRRHFEWDVGGWESYSLYNNTHWLTDSLKRTRPTHLLSQTLFESIKMGHAIFLDQLHFVVEFSPRPSCCSCCWPPGPWWAPPSHAPVSLLRQLLQHLLLLRLQIEVQKGVTNLDSKENFSDIYKVQRREARKWEKSWKQQWTYTKRTVALSLGPFAPQEPFHSTPTNCGTTHFLACSHRGN